MGDAPPTNYMFRVYRRKLNTAYDSVPVGDTVYPSKQAARNRLKLAEQGIKKFKNQRENSSYFVDKTYTNIDGTYISRRDREEEKEQSEHRQEMRKGLVARNPNRNPFAMRLW